MLFQKINLSPALVQNFRHSLYYFMANLLTNMPNFFSTKMNTIYYVTCALVSKLFCRISVKMSCISFFENFGIFSVKD